MSREVIKAVLAITAHSGTLSKWSATGQAVHNELEGHNLPEGPLPGHEDTAEQSLQGDASLLLGRVK